MRNPKYRVDTFPLREFDLSDNPLIVRSGIIIGGPPSKTKIFEDRIDEFAEQGWQLVSMFIAGDFLWVISRRSLWWRLTH